MKNKIYFFLALCFIALGEINAQSEDYAKYYNKANSLSESDFEKAEKNYRVATENNGQLELLNQLLTASKNCNSSLGWALNQIAFGINF